jgi:hypothetical protein
MMQAAINNRFLVHPDFGKNRMPEIDIQITMCRPIFRCGPINKWFISKRKKMTTLPASGFP